MNCEICGREIHGEPFRVKVEGAKLLVCAGCQRLGKAYEEEPTPRPYQARKTLAPGARPIKANLPKEIDEFEIAEDYADRVRRKRMKLGLSQDELAKRVREKLSVIQKIETGKIVPDTRLCKLLEHELKVKLLVPRVEASAPKSTGPLEVTLGDIVKIRNAAKSAEST